MKKKHRFHKAVSLSILVSVFFICFQPMADEADSDPQQEAAQPVDSKATITPGVTQTLTFEYFGDNGEYNENSYGDDDNFYLIRNITYVQAFAPGFDLGLRLDGAFFQDPPARVPAEDFQPGGSGYTLLDYDHDIRVERFHARAQYEDFSLTGGDFYAGFGRGIILSMIKIDDLGIDNAIRGARAEYGLQDIIRITAIGGAVNSTNLEPTTHHVLRDDPEDIIAGARIDIEASTPFVIGLHSVYVKPRFEDESEIDPGRLNVDQGTGVGIISGGGSMELNTEPVHLYVEGNGQQHDNYRPPLGADDVENESGYAFFSEISVFTGSLTSKLEGLFYHRWLMEGPLRGTGGSLSQPVPYHHMVTLEPKWMVIKSLGNEWGGRLTEDVLFEEARTQITAMATCLKYEGGLMPQGEWTDHPPTIILHPIVRLRQDFGSSGVLVVAEGGYRHEWESDEDDEGYLGHGSLDLTFPLTEGHTMEAKEELRRHHLDVTEENEYWISTATISYDMVGLWGIALTHEYSDQTAGIEGEMWGRSFPLPRKHYAWALFNFHVPDPLDGLVIRVLGGSQRGGIKCAAGICRNYPDTMGVRLETVYRY